MFLDKIPEVLDAASDTPGEWMIHELIKFLADRK